jgi:signal transduction histidine kinase
MKKTGLNSKKLILIVDDVPENLQVLAGYLSEMDFEVMPASNGPRALALIHNRPPDLILLDISMPEMDGLEVCRRIKTDSQVAHIPVIFLTARTESTDIVEGFEAGAVDYITKPFKAAELKARVQTQLEVKASRDLLQSLNQQLLRLNDHLKAINEDKNRFLGIVSHDIRGAFANVVSVTNLLADPEAVDADTAADLLCQLGLEAEHMIALAQNLLQIDAIERMDFRLQSEAVDTQDAVGFAVQSHRLAAKEKGIVIAVESEPAVIRGDRTACRQIVANLVSNAVKYSPAGKSVSVRVRRSEGHVAIEVVDEGPGISDLDQLRIFKPYVRLSQKSAGKEHSVGLGLVIVKRMAEHMGGTVRIESEVGRGSTFVVTLPEWLADSV